MIYTNNNFNTQEVTWFETVTHAKRKIFYTLLYGKYNLGLMN